MRMATQTGSVEGAYSLELLLARDLLPGDVLLTSKRGPLSSAIRRVTQSRYSHSGLYVSDGEFIHVNDHGVNIAPLTTYDWYDIFRVEGSGATAVAYAKELLGAGYDVSGVTE